MDTENENEQPISSSASSSNSSSSSNLLVNLPMLLSHADNYVEEQQMPLHPPSPPPPTLSLVSNQQHLAQQHTATAEQQLQQQQHQSTENSPLLFNNNSTPPPSSSSSSSSSSHNHQLHHHYQQHLENQRHHYHQHHHHNQQQHSPIPSPIQQNAPPTPQQQEQQQPPPLQQQHQYSIDDEDIADSIDASAIEEAHAEADYANVDLSVDVASTSQPREPRNVSQPELNTQTVDVDTVGVTNEPNLPPPALPLSLPREQSKRDYHPHLSLFPSLQHFHSSTGGCNSLFGAYNNSIVGYSINNAATMFSNSDTIGDPHTSSSHHHQHQTVDRLKLLYPNVNENETPLPRCMSSHDKCLAIGLSQNNLRVHYKGAGKQNNEPASVRTAHPIPPACGLYYFEVKIISKGKNGYMGIGLTAQQFKMNRLPGWDKQSYGYHGDDGNSFSSSGSGQSYGPTFTTGDIIGCCVNFVNNTCFYTKNGIDLGIAFRDLPTVLYPTVGLQTPGEEVDANFGQEPFKFDQIEDMIKQLRAETKAAIYDFPMPIDQGDPTALLHKMVSSYLVHNGYSMTAEAFARTTGQSFSEDLSSIKNRQKILKLVMTGKMGQAIEHTLRSYPGLLENNKNLLFMLKCRQFIEMVNGSDVEFCPANKLTITTNTTTTNAANPTTNSTNVTTQTQTTPPNQTSVIQSTKSFQNGSSNTEATASSALGNTTNTNVISTDSHQPDFRNSPLRENTAAVCEATISKPSDVVAANNYYLMDVEMENGHNTNGNSCKNGNSNNISNILYLEEEMDVDLPPTRKYCHGFERILEFGKELSQMGQQLEKENKMNDEDRQMLEDAFSLIAYSNPWSSPLGWQLCPSKREAVCSALNSAILESLNYSWRPPLEVCVAHAAEVLKVMAQASLGACAFVNIEDVFPLN